MKQILSLIGGLLIAANPFSSSANTNITVHLNHARAVGPHSNVWFFCDVSISNQTPASLTVTNLFSKSPGLALKVSNLDGKKLKTTYAAPLHAWTWTLPAGSQKTYKLMYGIPSSSGSHQNPGIALPDGSATVRVQIEGTLSGSGYSGSITSNVVEVRIPE